MRGSTDDASTVREDFEILTARDGDEGDPAGFGKADPGRRRGRNGGDDRRPEPRRLLDELDRDPAGQQHDAMRGDVPAPRERANELVERIVAPDVFPHGDKATRRIPKAGGMNGAGLAIKLLFRRKGSHGLDDRPGVETARVGDERCRASCFLEAFDAAESASGRPRHAAAAGGIGLGALLRQPES